METVTGIGTYALKYGTNKVTIVVTSESGIINNYNSNISYSWYNFWIFICSYRYFQE